MACDPVTNGKRDQWANPAHPAQNQGIILSEPRPIQCEPRRQCQTGWSSSDRTRQYLATRASQRVNWIETMGLSYDQENPVGRAGNRLTSWSALNMVIIVGDLHPTSHVVSPIMSHTRFLYCWLYLHVSYRCSPNVSPCLWHFYPLKSYMWDTYP